MECEIFESPPKGSSFRTLSGEYSFSLRALEFRNQAIRRRLVHCILGKKSSLTCPNRLISSSLMTTECEIFESPPKGSSFRTLSGKYSFSQKA